MTNYEKKVMEEIADDMSCDLDIVEEFYDDIGESAIDDPDAFRDQHAGTYKDAKEYAHEYCDSGCIEVPENLSSYVDYNSMGEDLLQDMHVIEDHNKIWVFNEG